MLWLVKEIVLKEKKTKINKSCKQLYFYISEFLKHFITEDRCLNMDHVKSL